MNRLENFISLVKLRTALIVSYGVIWTIIGCFSVWGISPRQALATAITDTNQTESYASTDDGSSSPLPSSELDAQGNLLPDSVASFSIIKADNDSLSDPNQPPPPNQTYNQTQSSTPTQNLFLAEGPDAGIPQPPAPTQDRSITSSQTQSPATTANKSLPASVPPSPGAAENSDCPDQNPPIYPPYSSLIASLIGQSFPIVKAAVSFFYLSDLTTPFYTTQADESGYFSLALNSSPPEADKDKDADQDKADQDKKDKDDEYILIAVSGGQVVDADNNGLLDSRPTPNTGSFHALVSLSQLTSGRLLRVSVLTDIVWRYTRHILNQTDKRGLAIRLEEIAKILLKEDKGDFDGDGVVKAADFLAFDPTNSHHWAGLNFDYQRLFTEDENGKSIINCYYQNNEQELLELLDKAFGALLTLYPTLGDKNPVVKIEVAPFGRGRVFEASGRLHFDSEGDPNQNLVAAFFDKNPGRKVVLTAEPIAETKILGWEGCDAVSADLTQCECQLDQDHTVRVSFGYKETKIVPNFIDLSEAEVIRDNYTLLVTIDPADSELQQKMAALTAGWYVVGSTGYGFLLKVVSVDKISDLVYRLETKEATLDEVVLQGTGTFSWKMTHKDLALPTATPVRLKAGPNSPPVWLLPSQDPNDKVFTLVLGDQPPDPQRQRTYSLTAGTGEVEVRLEVEGPQEIDIVVDGSLSLELQLDVGMSFSFFKGLESFRFIPKVIAKQNLSASLQAKLELFEKEKRLKFKSKKITLARLPFSSIKFFIGPVPVFITPQIEVLVGVDGTLTANIKAEIEFEESVEAGISYNKNLNPALTKIMNVPPVDFKPSLPHVEGGFELKFYLEPEGELLIYGVAGPAIPLTFFLALEGTVPPSGCVEVDCKLGIESEFKLLELNRKFGKYLGEIDIEIPLTIRLEWELGEWEFCDHAPGAPPPSEKLPHLEVRGSNVSKIIEYNYKGTISQTYQLINRGNKPLDWSISYSPDGIFSVSPQNGRLEGGESVTVTASVRGADLEIGKYKNTITFKNRSVSESFSRFFEITVNPPQIPLPTLRAAKILATKVILNWIVNNTENIDGYWLLKSTDPNPQIEDKDWDLAAEVPDKNQFSYKISKLSPDTVYYFMIIAYNKQGFESEPPPNLSSPPNFLKTTTSCYIQAGEETIQEAIDTVAEGKTLFVTPGVYYENIDFKGKSLTLKSTDPTNAEVVASTIIDGGQKGRVVTISIGKDKTAVLSGFTIRNGKATGNGGGILCSGNITISHCTISGNSASHDGGGIDCGGDRPATITISNCTISGNSARSGGGIWCNCYKRTTISNCTISGNSASWGGGICQFYYTNITNCILWANSNDQIYNYGHLSITYSNIQGGWDGEGNINADPLFADPEHGDYHLRPGSACINAGHPRMHDSDGSRIDMGAFGGGGENYPLMITYIVAADGSGNFSKIQEAIDSSISGDTIIVKAGLYQENLAIIGKEISLISQDGPEQTIIDGSKKERVICCIGRIRLKASLFEMVKPTAAGFGALAIPPSATASSVEIQPLLATTAGAAGFGALAIPPSATAPSVEIQPAATAAGFTPSLIARPPSATALSVEIQASGLGVLILPSATASSAEIQLAAPAAGFGVLILPSATASSVEIQAISAASAEL
ncbi:MAG: right-handed parallel beta-helix repeat-containing protein [bacterium]|nr:right-handed parallel beta-helix repeat-containing protein [bacterium]